MIDAADNDESVVAQLTRLYSVGSSLLNVPTMLTHEKLSTDLLLSNTEKLDLSFAVVICCLTC